MRDCRKCGKQERGTRRPQLLLLSKRSSRERSPPDDCNGLKGEAWGLRPTSIDRFGPFGRLTPAALMTNRSAGSPSHSADRDRSEQRRKRVFRTGS